MVKRSRQGYAVLSCLICLLWLAITVNPGLTYDNRHLIEDAVAGDPEAQYTLGHLYLKGLGGVEHSITDAIIWLSRAAEAGHVDSMYDLAMLLLEGHGSPGDREEALYWLEKSAELEHGASQYALGRAYGPVYPEKAIRWLKRAIQNGYPEAAEYLDQWCKPGLAGCE